MKRIRSIPRAISAVIAVLAGAVHGAIRKSRRPTPPTALNMPSGASPDRAANATHKHDADQPVQPYPEEIEIEGRLIELPQPSFWPMVLAFGVTLLFFGLVTSIGISTAGAIVIAWAIAGWISEIRHD